MTTFLGKLKWAFLLGGALTLPFIALEWVNTGGFPQGFPFSVFGFLWGMPAFFYLILKWLVVRINTGRTGIRQWAALILLLAVLVIIAVAWVNFIADQMPCFLGIPNCD